MASNQLALEVEPPLRVVAIDRDGDGVLDVIEIPQGEKLWYGVAWALIAQDAYDKIRRECNPT